VQRTPEMQCTVQANLSTVRVFDTVIYVNRSVMSVAGGRRLVGEAAMSKARRLPFIDLAKTIVLLSRRCRPRPVW
jgi:hypothetical protein